MPYQEKKQLEEERSTNVNKTSSSTSTILDNSPEGLETQKWVDSINNSQEVEDLQRWKNGVHGKEKPIHGSKGTKTSAARLKGDNSLKSIFDGTKKIKKGDRGLNITKLQQALIDMGYKLPKFGVDGKFEDETLTALKKYQGDVGVPASGELDQATIQAMDARFDKRTDYLKAASDFDAKDPKKGTRKLSSDDKDAALKALKPQPKVAGAVFDPADASAYSKDIKTKLSSLIPHFHQTLYADKEPLRADPSKNFQKDSDLEGAANAGKKVTDTIYGDLNKGPVFKMGINLIDQWDDEKARNSGLNDIEKKTKAKHKVEYLIDANCSNINSKYNANPHGTEEAKALAAVIESFIDDKSKVQILLDIETGWEGAQLQGTQYLQLYKEPSVEKNRLKMWELFHVSIHEYIHTLADSKYLKWAESLDGSQEHTLIEGFCDFFTMNIRTQYPPSTLAALQPQVEGSFHDPATPQPIPSADDINVSVYSSNEEAERMVGIIGIKNAQLGYFQGAVELMGK